MRLLFVFVAASIILTTAAQADTYVKGHTRSNGTYVQPHYRSDSNSTTRDNWSTKGNTNPYTGRQGTKNAYGSGSGYNNTNTNSWNTNSDND